MRVFFDTSVLVAALYERHDRHPRAFPWLKQAKEGKLSMVVASHSLAELYSVLSSLPVRPRLSPQAAYKLVYENIGSLAELVSLSPSEYLETIQRTSELGLAGGVTYDALLAKAAAKAGADRLLTFNERDFKRVWPEGENLIAVP
jgi:predicted nucleic acid-binding protein